MSEDPLTTEMVRERIHPHRRLESTSALLLPFTKAGPAAPLAQPYRLADGFTAEMVQRMLLAYPDFPADVLAAQPLDHKRLCRTFNNCTTAPGHGLVSGGYPLDSSSRDRDKGEQLAAIKARRKEVP